MATSLTRFAQEAEDVASGLHIFRDSLPQHATRITAIIGELFAISAVLRELENSRGDPRYGPSLYRIREDVFLVFPTLDATLKAILEMFQRTRERSHKMVWEDLGYRMEREEGVGLLERLQWYHDFISDLFDTLDGHPSERLGDLRRKFVALQGAQEATSLRYGRQPITASGASRPRPLSRLVRPPFHRIETPISPISLSDGYDFERLPPPIVPDQPTPVSPTFTSSSSQTLSSSQTSYSNDSFGNGVPQLAHWAQEVFNGTHPRTPFLATHQLDDRSTCHGTPDPTALPRLGQDGFVRALEVAFDSDTVWVRLYWRPADSRARILFMTKDSYGRQLHYCAPLTTLKVIRNRSSLQLCRARRADGRYSLWARLNFGLYERMVLFYSTFVAMKRQDTKGVDHPGLLEDFELLEEEEFGGEIRDGNMSHALRLYRDLGSGVVRIEASALRGAKQDVPIWTAFITRYFEQRDQYWVQLEDRRTVSMAALRPGPHVFVSGYRPPKNREEEYELRFETPEDASDFMATWAGLCRNTRA